MIYNNIDFFEKVLENNDTIKYLISKETNTFKKVYNFDDTSDDMYFVIICYEDLSGLEPYIDYDLNFINNELYNKLINALNSNNFKNIKLKCSNDVIDSVYSDTIDELYQLVVDKNSMTHTSITTFEMNLNNIRNFDDSEQSSVIDDNYNIDNYFKKFHKNNYTYKTYSNFIFLMHNNK